MQYGARPLRSTRRLSNLTGQRPGWYRIANVTADAPTQISIYDEIGFFGCSAGDFLADLQGVPGDIELHLNSPGGDVFDGIAIYNQLRQRPGAVHVIVDGLAASAASFIAQAASPGRLEMAPHAQMMIHNGFSMAIGDAADLRQTADLLDQITNEIASIYAERTGKPAAYWLAKMAAETWYTDKAAVEDGLADSIHGQGPAANSWDLSVFGRRPDGTPVLNADGGHAPMTGTHSHSHPAYASQGGDSVHSHEHAHDGDASHEHGHQADATPPADITVTGIRNADGVTELGDGWVQDPDGTVRFDPDGDGDDDSTPEGDTDHDYFDDDGNQVRPIPPKPGSASGSTGNLAGLWPVLAAAVDNSPWDGSRAWHNGAQSDDPEAFYRGICAGRKAGDPATQDAWALPYKYHPSDPPNADGVRAALSRLPQTKGLTNADEARATLQKAMKVIEPDYDPDAEISTPVLAEDFAGPRAGADESAWNPQAALDLAATSRDPARFFAGICAGRRSGDPATAAAWALPYRYTPGSAPHADGVREALAALPFTDGLTNPGEARNTLDVALKAIRPAPVPDDEIDPELLAAAFATGLKGAVS